MHTTAQALRALHEPLTLDSYLERYGSILGSQVQRKTDPLHVPSRDKLNNTGFKRTPFEAQAHVIAAGVKALRRQNTLIVVGEMGTGKAQPLDAKLLTPDGWITMADVEVGSTLIDPDGGTCSVLGVYPQGEKDIYKVSFSDGSSTECCEDHLWTVNSPLRKWKGKPARTLPLKELIAQPWTHKNGNLQFFIPIARVDYPERQLPLDPYMLGVLIGDGGLTVNVTVSSVDNEIIESVAACCPPGISVRKKAGNNCDYAITGGHRGGAKNPLKDALTELGLMGCKSYTKFIPKQYLIASREQRIELLRGLCDTDGNASRGYGVEFSTSSEQLALDVVELVQSLGGVVSWKTRTPRYTYRGVKMDGAPSHRLYLRMPPDVNPFRLSRKFANYNRGDKYWPTRAITKIELVGRKQAQCIMVDSQRNLYVTDDFIVTHNTLMGQCIAHNHAAGKPYRAIIMCPGQLVDKWRREIIETIPGATATVFSNWAQVLKFDRRKKAKGPEWLIVGRDMCKLSAFKKVAVTIRKREVKTLDKHDNIVTEIHDVLFCPKCGHRLMREEKAADKKGASAEGAAHVPMTLAELSKKWQSCPVLIDEYGNKDHDGKPCGNPLWSVDRAKVRKYAPADYINRHLKNYFDYFIIDEVHECKSDASAQAAAMGSLSACCKKTIALTGTLIGGSAEHLRPLLFRLSPASLVQEGFGWSNSMPFSERYGRIETRINEKFGGSDNRGSRGSSRSVSKSVKPGIMPTLFGRHLIDKAVFLALDQVAENLPVFRELCTPLAMDHEQSAQMEMIEEAMRNEIKALIPKMGVHAALKVMGPCLPALLGYTDLPTGWGELCYKDKDGEYVTICRPPNLDMSVIRPKEVEFLRIVKQELNRNRKCWAFVEFVEKHDCAERLRVILEKEGVKAKIMRSIAVKPAEREAWIAENGPKYDVLISHPVPVQTGLDFFDKQGSYNIPSILFYQQHFNAFVIRQAGRRAWRIGQRQPCDVFYLYYRNTWQERRMELMGRKIAASAAIEGKFSAEGLAAMAGEDDDMQMALARSLSEQVSSVNAALSWKKVSQVLYRDAKALTAAERIAHLRERAAIWNKKSA